MSLASSSIHHGKQDFPGCQISQPCRLRSHLWVKAERVTLFLGELGHLGRREAQEAGAEIWGFLGMRVCLYPSVFVHFQTHCSGQNTFEGCVLLSLLHNVFNWALPGFPHPSPMQDKLSYKYVSCLNEQMNSCMIFKAHVAASASEVSVVKEKLVFFAAVLSSFPLNRPNKCNGHQILHRNVMDDCVKEIPNFIFICRNFMVPESPLAVFLP